jgi:hypothetical protein
VAVQPRIHVKDQADLPGAQKVLAAITVKGLAQYQGKPAPKPLTYKYETPRLEPKVASSQLRFVDPRRFWSIFVAAMNENPPPKSQLEALLPNFRYLGIERRKPCDPNKVDPLGPRANEGRDCRNRPYDEPDCAPRRAVGRLERADRGEWQMPEQKPARPQGHKLTRFRSRFDRSRFGRASSCNRVRSRPSDMPQSSKRSR